MLVVLIAFNQGLKCGQKTHHLWKLLSQQGCIKRGFNEGNAAASGWKANKDLLPEHRLFLVLFAAGAPHSKKRLCPGQPALCGDTGSSEEDDVGWRAAGFSPPLPPQGRSRLQDDLHQRGLGWWEPVNRWHGGALFGLPLPQRELWLGLRGRRLEERSCCFQERR